MLISANNSFLKAYRRSTLIKYRYRFLFLHLILLTTQHDAFADKSMPNNKGFASHFNFLRGRKRVLWCASDPSVCLDRYKNPWGGTTCCFGKYCRDLLNDPNHCGSCERACGFGLACCGGNCVDTRNDPQHCGACFEVCPGEHRCTYSMCDYGG